MARSVVRRILQPPHDLLRGPERLLDYFAVLPERLVHVSPPGDVVVRRQTEQPGPIIVWRSTHVTTLGHNPPFRATNFSQAPRDPIPVNCPFVGEDPEVLSEFSHFLKGESHSQTEYRWVPLGRGIWEVPPREFA